MRLTKITPADIGNDATRTRTIAYDPIGQITEKRWPSGFTAAPITHTYAYLPDQNLAAATDGRGYTTSYGYDGFGRRNSETAPGSYSHQGDQTYDSQTTRWSYDPNSMITERISPADTRFSFDYDALDRLVKETNPAGESWRYAYNAASQTIAEISPRGLAGPNDVGADYQTTYHYDPADRLVEINAPSGREGYLDYDAEGNLTKQNLPGTDEADSRRVSTTLYDARGLPWISTIAAGTPEARSTATEYDPDSNLIRTVNPKGMTGMAGVMGAATTPRPSTTLDPIYAIHDPQIQTEHADTDALKAPTRHATVNLYDQDGLLRDTYAPHAIGAERDPDPDDHRYRQRYAYDPRGEISSIDNFYDFEAEPNQFLGKTRRTAYLYYETGWLKSQTDSKLVNPDQAGAGLHDTEIQYFYDRSANQTGWSTEGFFNSDPGSPGTTKGRKITRSFYPSGLLQSRSGQKYSDPETISRRSYDYFYNQNGSLIETFDKVPAADQAGAGATERTTKITRDDAERERFVDERWAGGTDTAFGYDAAGNIQTRRSAGAFALQSGASCNPEADDPDCAYRDGLITNFSYDAAERETKTCVTEAPPSSSATTAAAAAGRFQPWFRGSDAMVSQAQRQLAAAGGTPIRWAVAEPQAATAIQGLFRSRGISGIDVVHIPPG